MQGTITSTCRVLLVDDDPLVCDSIRRMLEFDRHKVHIAPGAAEALAICEKHSFDVIILDYIMPVMKGDQLAVRLKERIPDRPIIMITADAEKVDSPEKKPPGVDLIVCKPFQLEDLREALSNVLLKT